MGRTEQLLGWRNLLCFPSPRAPLDRHSVSATPAIGAPLQADDIHSIKTVAQFDDVESLSTFVMRAFVINKLNHPSKIELTKDAPEPKQVPDRVLVDVYSAGLNFFDVSACFDCPNPPYFAVNESAIDDVLFPRFCRLRGNTRFGRNSRLSWVQSLPGSSRETHSSLWVVRSNPETGCSDTLKARMRTKSLLTPGSYCLSRRT